MLLRSHEEKQAWPVHVSTSKWARHPCNVAAGLKNYLKCGYDYVYALKLQEEQVSALNLIFCVNIYSGLLNGALSFSLPLSISPPCHFVPILLTPPPCNTTPRDVLPNRAAAVMWVVVEEGGRKGGVNVTSTVARLLLALLLFFPPACDSSLSGLAGCDSPCCTFTRSVFFLFSPYWATFVAAGNVSKGMHNMENWL